MKYVLDKPTLIDLEARKRVTGRKAESHRERLSERGAQKKSACDSLNSTNNLMKVEREIRRGFSAAKAVVTNWYIAQAENDQLEVRIRFFANLFNAKPAGSAVLTEYVSP